MKQPIERLFRWSTSLVAVALLALALPAAAQEKKPVGGAQGKPNIVIIWGDDIGQSDISAYSMGLMGFRTPNIDRVAREGMIFTDFYAEQSCTAGRASFITGQSGTFKDYPQRQKAASFNMDEVFAKLQESGGSK